MRTHWLVMDESKNSVRAPYRARLAAAGGALAATPLSPDALMATTRHNTHIDLERLTGIHERRVSVGEEDSYSLCAWCTRLALTEPSRSLSSAPVPRLPTTIICACSEASTSAGTVLDRSTSVT